MCVDGQCFRTASSMQTLAKAIANPAKTPPQRLPSFPALERTAVMGFNASLTTSVGSGDRFLLFRQAFWPLWMQAKDNLGWAYGVTYTLSHMETTVNSVYEYAEPTGVFGVFNGTSSSGVSVPTISGSIGNNPAGYAVLGVDAGTGSMPWVWIAPGAKLVVSSPKTAAAAIVKVNVEFWQAPGVTSMLSNSIVTFTTSTTVATASTSGNYVDGYWARIRSVQYGAPVSSSLDNVLTLGCAIGTINVGGDPETWTITGSTTNCFLPATCSSEFTNSALPWSSTRLTAVAALFTNTTKVMNKEGTVLWGRINPMLTDPYRFSATTLSTLHPAEKAFMDLETGCYAYNPPSDDMNSFHPYVQTLGTSRVFYPVQRLDNLAMVAAAVFNDPDGGTNLAINLDWHVEFRTSSTLFQIGVSNLPLEALHGAQLACLKAGFFSSNLDHRALIQAVISGLGSLHPLLRVMAPIASGLYGATSVAVGKDPAHNTPQATSGQKSGLVTVKPKPASGGSSGSKPRSSSRAPSKGRARTASPPRRGRSRTPKR